MKHHLLRTLLCTLALCLLPVTAPATTVESPLILGGTGRDTCYSTLPLPNGNLILAMASDGGRNGEAEYADNVRKVWLLCLAPDGSTVWETTFGEEIKGGTNSFYAAYLNGDGTFSGTLRLSIDQRAQYRQKLTFSCADGSLVSQGEQVMNTRDEDKLFREYFTHDGYTLVLEAYDCEATCEPRILRMLDAEGTELWRFNAADLGLHYVQNWVLTGQGALLYGSDDGAADGSARPTAILIDNGGQVLWTYQASDLADGSIRVGILDSDGRFVGTGATNGVMQEGAAFDPTAVYSQLLVCLDTATGAEVWRHISDRSERRLPYDDIAEINGQYILCDTANQYTDTVFELVDREGNELQFWTTSIPGHTVIYPQFFLWNGELWTETLLEGTDSDVLLERVVIPVS